jgi:hypothetical protein
MMQSSGNITPNVSSNTSDSVQSTTAPNVVATSSHSTRHSSGSSRSSRRRRSRSHGHHRHRRRRRHSPKRSERNLVAAILGIVVIAVLISSLAEQKWFYLHGGKCSKAYIGAYQFLTSRIESSPAYKNCLNSQVVAIMRAIIVLIFFSITSSLFAFFLDILGPLKPSLRLMRRHAVGNIVTVLLCLVMSGLCYWSASLMEDVLQEHKYGKGSKVYVSFEVGYYLVVASGALSVIISATNLLRPYSSYDETTRERLIEDWDQLLEAELASTPTGPPFINSASLPEPPAYTP